MMSPHEMMKYNEAFNLALTVLGWQRRSVTEHHERDWDRSWENDVVVNANGIFMFDISDVGEALVQEIIRLAGLMPNLEQR